MVKRKKADTFRNLSNVTLKKFLKQVSPPTTKVGRKNRQEILRILREKKKKR